MGKPLLGWQQRVLDVALEQENDLFVYREVILTVPRQSGKTTLILTLILLRALLAPGDRIVYTAQTRNDARKKLVDDWLPELDKSPFKQFYDVRLANGSEALRFKNGSLASLVATTKKSGHGGTLDLGILDEAFAQADYRMEQSLKPAMMTRPQPQLWVVSTAGTAVESPYLYDKVQHGREIANAGLNHSVCYFEWSAEENADPSDPATWYSCMPALDKTQPVEAVRADFETMSELSEFRRAYLNQWTSISVDPVIPLAIWDSLEDRNSRPLDPVVVAFDIPPNRSSGVITAGGKRSDGKAHIEVVAQQPGITWIIPAIVDLAKTQKCLIVCDKKGPAASLLPELERLGIAVMATDAEDMARACGMFYDAAMNDGIRHLGDLLLHDALDGAVRRDLTDRWAWSRRNSAVDISPLVAATLSYWGVVTQEARPPGVWDLNEIVERLRREESGAPVEPETPKEAPPQMGQRFIPLTEMPARW